ncbi:methyltransferase domain-containing protein [Streptomyces mirabilis]|uniref:methyltransferase domain-containing protein n=1 Tax=Streptomyces mirabilis TaxID=68239 RepID=UPI0036B8F5BD
MLKSAITDYATPGSISHSARARRWAEMMRYFPELAAMRVLDLGGTPESWNHAPVLPAQVVCVNIHPKHATVHGSVTGFVADACDLPDTFRSEHFDLVYSNSLMEHVGGHDRRKRFADTVHAKADHHWIQTPYRYFPVEPHWLFPGMQWLPFRTRVAISQYWPHGPSSRDDLRKATADVADVELLSATEMRSYFPGSQIWFERFAGLPKSLVARKMNY